VLIVFRKLDGNEKYKKKDYKGAIGKECGNEMRKHCLEEISHKSS
jgi:hypothetical protein